MASEIQFRSQEREDISEVSARFLVSMHKLATDPNIITAFAEGHVVGRYLNIDGEEWVTTGVAPVPDPVGWGGQLYFWVSGDKASAVEIAENEQKIREALSAYESKMRAAAAELIEVCLQKKVSPELLHKILKGDK